MHTSNLYKKILLLFSSIVFAINAHATETFKKLDKPIVFPNETVLDGNGKPIILKFNENLRKNGYVINFWATWCVPCKKELPDLGLLKSKIKKYNIDVLTISIDQKIIEEQISFLSKNGANNLTHYFDKKMLVYKSLKLRGIPTTVLVDSQGQVISLHEGIMKWGNDLIVSEIKNLFN
jgi:thiol-disulfide isomerase/thioredoxin